MCVYVQSYGSVEEEQLSSENSKNGSKCFSVAPLVTRAGKKKIGQFLSQIQVIFLPIYLKRPFITGKEKCIAQQ